MKQRYHFANKGLSSQSYGSSSSHVLGSQRVGHNWATELNWTEPMQMTLMAESEEGLKSLLMKVKEESKKAALKLNIQRKLRSWHLVSLLHGK